MEPNKMEPRVVLTAVASLLELANMLLETLSLNTKLI